MEPINYDDDLFFIIARLQNLQDGLKLKLDGIMLKKYYLIDLREISLTLNFLGENLTTKNNLIRINEYLYSLGRARRLLNETIETILKTETDFTKGFIDDLSDLRKILNEQSTHAEKSEDILSNTNFKNEIESDVLSEEEMNILFGDDLNFK